MGGVIVCMNGSMSRYVIRLLSWKRKRHSPLVHILMAENLCLNQDKTEVLLVASKTVHKKLNIPHVTIGNEEIVPAKEIRNIGFVFDHIMNI